MTDFKIKYYKYKSKYLNLKSELINKQSGGAFEKSTVENANTLVLCHGNSDGAGQIQEYLNYVLDDSDKYITVDLLQDTQPDITGDIYKISELKTKLPPRKTFHKVVYLNCPMDNVVPGYDATTSKYTFTVYNSILASVADFYNNDMLDDNCSIIITNFIDLLYTIFKTNKIRGGSMLLRILDRESKFLEKQIGEHGKSFKIPIQPSFAGPLKGFIVEIYATGLEHKSNVLGFLNLIRSNNIVPTEYIRLEGKWVSVPGVPERRGPYSGIIFRVRK